MAGRIAIAAAVLAALAPASAAPAATVLDAGSLRARVAKSPWHLELVDAGGRTVLAESRGAGADAAGALGFRTQAGWEHATRVVSSKRRRDSYSASLATTEPGRTLEIDLVRDAEGVIGLVAEVAGPGPAVEAVGLGFEARPGERYLGFGERSNAVDQGGGVVESYVSDGPYQAEEYPVINLFTPMWGLRDGRPEATYYPVPWLLSTAGYGVLAEDPRTSYFRLDGQGSWSVEVAAVPEDELGAPAAPITGPVRFQFYAGPRPAGALRRFTDVTGRQPRPAAPWVLGPWYQADDSEPAELALLREADAPVSVLQTYTHYLPCGDQRGREQSEAQRIADAHGSGVAITTYFNPMICTSYEPAYGRAAAAGALTATAGGEPYVYRYGADVDQAFFVSQFDFFTEAGIREYTGLLEEAIADGYDGWMEDFGEYTPLDSVSDPHGERIPGTEAHNRYATLYHCAAYLTTVSAPRPIVRFQRSGWTGGTPCAQVVWGGDPTTSFGFDGLSSAVTQALSAGTSGIGIWGSDIGGFFALGANRLDPELLMRWVQFGAASVVMRTQANGVAFPSKPRPQVIDSDQLANWRRYAKLHTQLYPYLTAAIRAYRRTGMPPMRHLGLVDSRDARAVAADDQFLLGPDLLVAPVLEAGVTERTAYLPRGRWVDLWRSAEYREGSGGLRLGHASELRGGREHTVPAPLDELPLFVRTGGVLALLPPKVDTLAAYGNRVRRLDTLLDVRRSLRLLAFPRGATTSRFGKRDRLLSAEGDGTWTLEIDGELRRRYRLEASLATLREPFRPCRVEIDGRELSAKRWSFERGVLRADFSGKSPQLAALACGTR